MDKCSICNENERLENKSHCQDCEDLLNKLDLMDFKSEWD